MCLACFSLLSGGENITSKPHPPPQQEVLQCATPADSAIQFSSFISSTFRLFRKTDFNQNFLNQADTCDVKKLKKVPESIVKKQPGLLIVVKYDGRGNNQFEIILQTFAGIIIIAVTTISKGWTAAHTQACPGRGEGGGY